MKMFLFAFLFLVLVSFSFASISICPDNLNSENIVVPEFYKLNENNFSCGQFDHTPEYWDNYCQEKYSLDGRIYRACCRDEWDLVGCYNYKEPTNFNFNFVNDVIEVGENVFVHFDAENVNHYEASGFIDNAWTDWVELDLSSSNLDKAASNDGLILSSQDIVGIKKFRLRACGGPEIDEACTSFIEASYEVLALSNNPTSPSSFKFNFLKDFFTSEEEVYVSYSADDANHFESSFFIDGVWTDWISISDSCENSCSLGLFDKGVYNVKVRACSGSEIGVYCTNPIEDSFEVIDPQSLSNSDFRNDDFNEISSDRGLIGIETATVVATEFEDPNNFIDISETDLIGEGVAIVADQTGLIDVLAQLKPYLSAIGLAYGVYNTYEAWKAGDPGGIMQGITQTALMVVNPIAGLAFTGMMSLAGGDPVKDMPYTQMLSTRWKAYLDQRGIEDYVSVDGPFGREYGYVESDWGNDDDHVMLPKDAQKVFLQYMIQYDQYIWDLLTPSQRKSFRLGLDSQEDGPGFIIGVDDLTINSADAMLSYHLNVGFNGINPAYGEYFATELKYLENGDIYGVHNLHNQIKHFPEALNNVLKYIVEGEFNPKWKNLLPRPKYSPEANQNLINKYLVNDDDQNTIDLDNQRKIIQHKHSLGLLTKEEELEYLINDFETRRFSTIETEAWDEESYKLIKKEDAKWIKEIQVLDPEFSPEPLPETWEEYISWRGEDFLFN